MIKTRVFLAAPISSFLKQEEYAEYRESMLQLIQLLKEEVTVYSELENIGKKSDYDSPKEAASNDFAEIVKADIFMIHHPSCKQTSSLIELGYALALKKPIIIVSQEKNLPYLALGLPALFDHVIIINTDKMDRSSFELILSAIKEINRNLRK